MSNNINQVMRNKKVKAIVIRFYKRYQESFDYENIHAFMLLLEKSLVIKGDYTDLDDNEAALFLTLLKDGSQQDTIEYSERLTKEFKNILKGVAY